MKPKLVSALIVLAAIASGEELAIPHIRVEYSGIEASQAKALAETLAAAREVCRHSKRLRRTMFTTGARRLSKS